MRHTARFITLTTALISGLIAIPGAARADDASDARIQRERPAAIRALYGVGLAIKTERSSISIDWGSLDAATWQRYVSEHYAPALDGWSSSLHVDTQFVFGETRIYVKKLGAHALIEPIEKLALCERLAGTVDDHEDELRDFCREQALRHVASPVIAFRGAAVRHDSPTRFVGARLDEPLFAGSAGRRDVLITVPGPGQLDSFRGYRAVGWIANGVRYNAPGRLKELAAAANQAAARGSQLARQRMKKRDKPFAKPRGNVLFTDVMIEGWEPIKPLSKRATPRCWDSYAQIYGPRKKGYYDLTVRANGTQCSNNVESAGFIKRRSVYGECSKQLRSGKNTIAIVVAKNVNRKVGKRWDKRELRTKTIHSNKAGKVLVTARLTCTK